MLSGELTRNHPNTQHAKAVASTIKFIGFFVAKFDLKDEYVSEKNQNQKTFIVVVEVFSHGNRESLIKSEILQELIRLEKILVQPYITTVHSSGS